MKMELDRKFNKKKLPDKLNSSISKEKGDVFAKSVGCSSLMMKNFENNASLLKLGIGRVTNLAVHHSLGRNNSPLKDTYNKLLSSSPQANVQFTEVQKTSKEFKQDSRSHTSTPTTLRQLKPQNSNFSFSSNESSDSSSNSNHSNSPESSSKNGHFRGSCPHNPLKTTGSLTSCPILGKTVSPTSVQHSQTNSNSNFLSLQNTNKLFTPLTQTRFTQDLDEKFTKDLTDSARLYTDGSNESRTLMSNSFDENLNTSHKTSDFTDFSSNNSYYGSVFDDIDQSIPMLKKIFISPPNAASDDTPLDRDDESSYNDKFEWIPTDPNDINVLSTKGEIVGLFEDNFEEDCDGFLVSNYYNKSQVDLDEKLYNLSTIHESLYTSSEAATLRTLEKFLFQLLQQKSHYGNLTPFGKLLAFINLSFLKKHINLLDSLYKHPEMSVIRNVLATNARGQITKTLNSSAGISEGHKLTNEESVNMFTQVLNKTNKDAPVTPTPVTANVKGKNIPPGMKQNKQRLGILDTLSGMYKPGGEPHFPRYVCGTIDRSLVTSTETLSIPFEKTEKHNVHVQFEKFDNDDTNMWPKLTTLPQNISEGTFVQVAPLKYTGNMTWKAGMVVSISSGQLSIRIPNEQKERMYLLRNLVPPNVPIVKPDKGYWRLLPRELDVSSHLYVGSCLSLLDLAEPDESVDVVVLNVFYSQENSPIAPVKLPSDETNFQHPNNKELEAANIKLPETEPTEMKLRTLLPDYPLLNADKLNILNSESFESRSNLLSNTSSTPANLNENSSDTKDSNEFFDAVEFGDDSYTTLLSDSKEFKENKNKDFSRFDFEDKFGSTNLVNLKTNLLKSQRTGTCTCNGYTLRIFEGKCLGVPERILVHSLHDKKEHMLKVSDLKGFKLNYDLQSHFDGPTGNAHVHNNVWVIPRNISFLGDTLLTKDSFKPGYSWLFKPEYCLVMFPFSRNSDVLQEFCRLIPFLHPELNYLALCAGLWSLRNKPELRERESVSFTRSQKAAIRDLTSNDVVSEVCMDLARCPFSLTRRLYGCFPVISFWIALDSYDPETDKEPSIPNNIKVPKPTMCDKCNGMVISKTGMVKIISNKYTQILAKKLSKRTKDAVTTNPSLENLPQLDESLNKTVGTSTSKDHVDGVDKGLDQPDKDVSVSNSDSFSSSKDFLDKDGTKVSKGSDKDDKQTSGLENLEQGSDTHNVDDLNKKGTEGVTGSGTMSKSNDELMGNKSEGFFRVRSGPSTKIYDAIFSPNVEYDVTPVLTDLERAEDWVKKLQSLANSRWRVTKEFNASYTVDDEFSMLTTSPTSTSANKPNSEFIIQLAGVMNNIKKGKDSHIDSNLVYKLYQLAEECTSTTEGALLTGWSSYLLSEPKIFQPEEQPLIQPLLPMQSTNGPRHERDCPYSNMCPMNFNCPRGTKCPYASSHSNTCPLKPSMRSLNGLGSVNPLNHQLNCPIRKCNIDFSNNYTKLLMNNPIINMPTNCKRRRDEEYKKLAAFNKMHKKNRSVGTILPKLGVQSEQSSKNIAKEPETENPFINDPYDFCKFTDNPKRKKFISSLKWDEDVEF